jgi:hypothetical protein
VFLHLARPVSFYPLTIRSIHAVANTQYEIRFYVVVSHTSASISNASASLPLSLFVVDFLETFFTIKFHVVVSRSFLSLSNITFKLKNREKYENEL